MPRRLRLVVYSVILALSLYMYWVAGQAPVVVAPPTPSASVLPDPLRLSGSLNIRREQLTSLYESTPFNLTFDYVPLADGRSRVVGRSGGGDTVLELIGPPEGVTSANLMAFLPPDKPLVRLKNMNALSLLIETVLSDWTNADSWVSTNIDAAFSGESVTTQANGKLVSMSVAPQTQTLVVTVTGPPL